MESSDRLNDRRFGRLIVTVVLICLALGACAAAFAGYRLTKTMTDRLAEKQAEYNAVIAEKQTLVGTITEQGQAITDLDIEKREAQNKLNSLEDALK